MTVVRIVANGIALEPIDVPPSLDVIEPEELCIYVLAKNDRKVVCFSTKVETVGETISVSDGLD